MKPLRGYNNAQASTGYERLEAGGYVVKITGVHDEAADDKQYLKVCYDIAEGPEAGRYKDIDPKDNNANWRCSFIRSYKETALGMFKAFIMAIDETNGTKFGEAIEGGFDEQKLVGRYLGVVFGYEEYEANDGNVKERLYVKSCMSADRIRTGDYKVPALKKMKAAAKNDPIPGFTALTDSDIPF